VSVVIVIPARMGASRFPGKPLADLCGKPMIQWVYESARDSDIADHIIVATPDQEIVDICSSFGADALLTSHSHQTGTDRIAEVAHAVHADVYVNVQGDEPLMRSTSIADCARPLMDDTDIMMASVYCDCPPAEYDHPAVVKVVTDLQGYALYFSRHAIPYERNARVEPVKKHIGLYAYRRSALMAFAEWPMTPLEAAESLEQLRFMENGVRIFMSPSQGTELAVDTPEQAEEVRRILASRTK
jgi:3-deoxy-D-manno-octulosonate cytidylyltransferase